jgi:hypothetical protein
MRIRIIFISMIILSFLNSYSQTFAKRSHAEFGIGFGKRAYINSKSGVLRSTSYINHVVKINNVIAIRHGLDVIYWDKTFDGKNFGTGSGYLLTSTSYEHFAYGYLLGLDVVMNRITFQMGLGKYLYYNQMAIHNYQFYSKLGFKYKISNTFYFNGAIRGHGIIADYVDFGIGIKIGDKKL